MPAVYGRAAVQPETQTGCRSGPAQLASQRPPRDVAQGSVEEAPSLQHGSITMELDAVCGHESAFVTRAYPVCWHVEQYLITWGGRIKTEFFLSSYLPRPWIGLRVFLNELTMVVMKLGQHSAGV
jgi:hypothetical protein